MLPPIAPDANKYTRGSLLVLAGSHRFPGAAVLAAKAAVRTGAGYVTLAIPEPALQVAQSHLLSVPVLPASAKDGAFAADAWDAIRGQLRHIDAVVIGPGLTVTASTCAFVGSVLLALQESGIPTLIDADALNILAAVGRPEAPGAAADAVAPGAAVADAVVPGAVAAGQTECRGLLDKLSDGRTSSTLFVLTPHAGELRRLAAAVDADGGDDAASDVIRGGATDGRNNDAAALAAMLNAVVVAKAPTTRIVAAAQSHSSSTGTAALAKAGTGDVLSGIIGSLLAQGMPPFDAAKLGVELHGQAGQLAEQRYGQRSVCAEDLLETLPLVLKDIEGGALL